MWSLIRTACFLVATALLAVDSREAAPAFHATTLDGEKLTKDGLKGKTVLVQFWTTWCGYCRRDQPSVDALTREFQSQGLVVLAVNVGESRQKVEEFLQKSPRTPKIVLTEHTNLGALFAPQGFPLYVLLDKEGKIAGRQEGAGGEAALRQLLGKAGLGSTQ